MLRVINWLRQYWYIPFVALGTTLSYVFLMRRRATPIMQTKAELGAIRAATSTAKIQAELGMEKAKRNVEIAYAETILALDEKQKEKAKELQDDPAKLAKFLVRAGSSIR